MKRTLRKAKRARCLAFAVLTWLAGGNSVRAQRTPPAQRPRSPRLARPAGGAQTDGPSGLPAAVTREDAARFGARVQALLGASSAARGFWGVLVADADTGEWLYALNPYRYFQPASNAKLFTTAMALATLGPDFRVRTTIETAGNVDRMGRLHGDLVLAGRGDANLSSRVFPYQRRDERDGPPEKVLAELADKVVARGVKEIDGDIIADDSYLAPGRFPPGWTIDDTVWNYGAAVSAIAVNDNTMTLLVRPGRAPGAPLAVALEPQSGLYEVRNDATTTPAGSQAQLVLARDPDSRVIHLSGTLPADAPARELPLAVPQPAEQAAALLARLLEARGVRATGHARARHAGDAGALPGVRCCAASSATPPEATTVLAERLSPRLGEDVLATNKLSLNLHAELLLRVAAKEKGGAATLDDALKFASEFRDGIGIGTDDALLNDGSGLSRDDLVTPRAVLQLLTYAATQPWGAAFAASLPVAGQDGTLENRMKGTAAAGRVHAKSGLVDHVAGLSGYATSARGERLAFSLFGNNAGKNNRDATAVLDAICAAMVEELGALPAAPAAPEQQPEQP